MTPEPTSLFDKGFMRKTDKSKFLKDIVKPESMVSQPYVDSCHQFIIDGGALLRKVRWCKNETFREIANKYTLYIKRNFNSCTVVFDGYDSPSTKDHEHERRCSIPLSCLVSISDDAINPYLPDKYFTLNGNKAKLVKYLSEKLRNAGVDVIECLEDADCMIVKSALLSAQTNQGPTAVVVDDTDVIVMLMHHWNDNMDDVVVVQQNSRRSWSIKTNKPSVNEFEPYLLFLHAWSGCDTTSSTFGEGKSHVSKTFRKFPLVKTLADTITDEKSNQDEVGDASEKMFKLTYGCSIDQTLTSIR